MLAGTAEDEVKEPFCAAAQIALFRDPVFFPLGIRARVAQRVDRARPRSSHPCVQCNYWLLCLLLLHLRLLLLLLRLLRLLLLLLRLLRLLLLLLRLLARTTATARSDRGGFGAERRDKALSVHSVER